MLTAGTVGRIIDENPHDKTHDGYYVVEFLDGTTEQAYRYSTGFMSEEQVKEVVEYYTKKEKRPERVQADWALKL
jgi:hypothetical protein